MKLLLHPEKTPGHGRELFPGLLLLSLLSLALLNSCGEGSSTASSTLDSSGSGGDSAHLTAGSLEIARAIDVLHSGVRLVTTEDTTAGIGAGMVQFLERVTSDGTGRFALEPIGPFASNEPPSATWSIFSIIQTLRQGTHMRYRDFEVRDPATFQREWCLKDLGMTVMVAGRSCRRFDALDSHSARRYELSIDEQTHLVLDQREVDSQGRELMRVTYQSLDLDPNLANIVWYDSLPIDNYPLDSDLKRELGVDVRIPTNPPEGYSLYSLDVIHSDAKGDDTGPWLRVVYTNGVDPLFYLVGIPGTRQAAQEAHSAGPSAGPAAGAHTLQAISLGRVSGVVGSLPQGRIMAAGRVTVDELSDLVASALP